MCGSVVQPMMRAKAAQQPGRGSQRRSRCASWSIKWIAWPAKHSLMNRTVGDRHPKPWFQANKWKKTSERGAHRIPNAHHFPASKYWLLLVVALLSVSSSRTPSSVCVTRTASAVKTKPYMRPNPVCVPKSNKKPLSIVQIFFFSSLQFRQKAVRRASLISFIDTLERNHVDERALKKRKKQWPLLY